MGGHAWARTFRQVDGSDWVLSNCRDEPTIAYFEEHGFQYTTYTIGPEGRVTDKSYHVQAPFPEVNEEMIERFIEGEL